MARGQRILRVQGRLPYPHEVFDRDESYSGTPGFEYALVLGQDLGKYVAGTAELGRTQRWQQMDRAPLIVVEAANGVTLDNIVVLCRGERIEGALPTSSRCPWYVDETLMKAGGFRPNLVDDTAATKRLAEKAAPLPPGALRANPVS